MLILFALLFDVYWLPFVLQESFALEKYVEKLAQLNPDTGLGPLSKSKSKPFEPRVSIKNGGL